MRNTEIERNINKIRMEYRRKKKRKCKEREGSTKIILTV